MQYIVGRRFTSPDDTLESVLDSVKWVKQRVVIKDSNGKVEIDDKFEFPDFWEQNAIKICVSKYFAKDPEVYYESSLRQLITRIVKTISSWAGKEGYFNGNNKGTTRLIDKDTFEAELAYIMLHQIASFNSPVLFNVGVPGRVPQSSACFILGLDDNIESILGWWKTATLIYKGGSGEGTNISKLRGSNEGLSGGGISSGAMSFNMILDKIGGVIKAGGRARRAARMVIMDVDHPDIEYFIESKTKEEEKARILINGGIEGGLNGEAYQSVSFQNANHSVAVTDAFMRAVENDEYWQLINRTNGKVAKRLKARKLFNLMCQHAWQTGDPGLFFIDTVNKWHTCKNSGPIRSSNPCQPWWTPIPTEDGVVMLKDLKPGMKILTKEGWATVKNVWSTGKKKVWAHNTSHGVFYSTEDHKVVSSGTKIPVAEAKNIDLCKVNDTIKVDRSKFNKQDIIDGFVFGRSRTMRRSLADDTIAIEIDSRDEVIEKYPDFILNEYYSALYRSVKTTLTKNELSAPSDAEVPDRFVYADYYKIAAFLHGFVSARAKLFANALGIEFFNEKLARQIQYMLSIFGIKSVLHKTHNQLRCYLYISESLGDYIDKIGLISTNVESLARHYAKTAPLVSTTDSPKVESAVCVGEEDVYDLEVDNKSHTYWSFGFDVSNCSEYLSLDNTSCNLASVNLIKFFDFEKNKFDLNTLLHTVRVMQIAMDAIVDNASYPSEIITKRTKELRNLGLGFSNIGGLLMALGVPYDSDIGRKIAAMIMSSITACMYDLSGTLVDYGYRPPFPLFKENEKPMREVLNMHMNSSKSLLNSAKGMDLPFNFKDILLEQANIWNKALSHKAYCNSQVTVIAPTGTIGLLMSCATLGIEPELSLVKFKQLVDGETMKYVNNVLRLALRTLGYEDKQEEILQYILENNTVEGCQYIKQEHLPVFDCSFKPKNGIRFLRPEAHLLMLAEVAPFLSGSASKTINMPSTATVDDIAKIYMSAWKLGIKAISVYRDGSKLAQPLVTDLSKLQKNKGQRRKLPDIRPSITHKFTVGQHEGYITVGLYEDDSPGEIFIRIAKEGSFVSGIIDNLAMLMSMLLQYGIPIEEIIRKLKNSHFEPYGWTNNPDIKKAYSITDYIAKWLEYVFVKKKINLTKFNQSSGQEETNETKFSYEEFTKVCPNCGSLTAPTGNCYTCVECGTSLGCS
jgi:ribonucleoside-diphosphate reductase alpha chain